MTHRRRGLAMVMAVMLIGLTGVILFVLAGRMDGQQRRTRAAADDAQAAQLVAAGVRFAEAGVASPQNGPVATPVGQVVLTWTGPATRRVCAIDVAVGVARRGVTVTFDGEHARSIE